MDLSIDAKVQEIKKRIAQAQKEQARAEHVYDSAKASVDKLRERLHKEFGIETSEQAKQVLADLETQLQQALERANQALSQIG